MPNKDVNYQVNVVKGRESGIDSLQRAKQTADRFEDSLTDATRQAAQLDRELDKAGRSSSINLGRAGGGLERILNAAGGGQLSGIVSLAGDIGDVVESLGEGGLKGALSSLISPMGALGAIAGATAIAVALVTTEYERQKKAATEYLNYIVGVAQTEESLLQKLRDGGTAAIDEVRNAQDDQLALISAGANRVRDEIARLEEEINGRGFQFSIGPDPLITQLQVAREQLDLLNGEAQKLEPSVMALSTVLGSADYAAAKMNETLEAGTSAFAAVTNQAGGALSKFTDIMTRAKKASDEAAEAAREASEAAQKAFTDLQTAAQEQVDKLDAQQSALSRALQDTIADLNDDLISAQTQANADIAAAQAESNAARLASEKEYLKASARAEEEYQRENSRIRRDAQISERQAIQQNDISAVLDIRENRRNQIADNRAAFKLEKQQRAEDFADQRAVEEAALAARIADIQRARDEEVSALQAEMTAARAAHEEEKAEIIRLRDGEIERVRAVALANQARYAAEEAAIARITGQLATAPASTGGGVIPFSGPQSTAGGGGLFGGLSASSAASGVSVIVQNLNLGEIATPGGVSSAIMNLTQLFAQAFQQLRVGA
ncbi:MAG: hypothetical protein IPK52_27570 [Chloroflexi bacterium]|nr:hypothetical protein [Chloroflexota bacterium]